MNVSATGTYFAIAPSSMMPALTAMISGIMAVSVHMDELQVPQNLTKAGLPLPPSPSKVLGSPATILNADLENTQFVLKADPVVF